ncbi:MAG: GIY-YIG nuclease family protein, partial [Cytophagaceae bacterium]
MNISHGKSVRLHMVEGTPHGILTAEIINWTGHVLSAPRSKLAGLLARPEITKAGVYILVGPKPDDLGQTFAYIGQSENIGRRLVQHNKDDRKAFWEKTCIITSKDPNLTSGHIKYLESRLITTSAKSGLVILTNDTAPEPSSLPEADIADMEYFLVQLRLMLPLLGYEFLKEMRAFSEMGDEPDPKRSIRSPIFEIASSRLDLLAQAQEVDGEFVVQAGSRCRPSWEGTPNHHYRNLRETLYQQNKIGTDASGMTVFKEDIAFSSPSAAAAVVYGRASNGRTAWKIKG